MTWLERAGCLGTDPEVFFVGYGLGQGQGRISDASLARALALCASCPVTAECLDYAMTRHQDEGIWGGMTARQRIKLRRRAKVA